MKKLFYVLLLACLNCAILAGCGGGNASTDSALRVGGEVTGLQNGKQLIVWEKDQSITISQNGPFNFSVSEPVGSRYLVYVSSQPDGQVCTLSNESGTIGTESVTNVQISCSSGLRSSASPYANYVPPTGCGCHSSWSYNGKTISGNNCANPDNDPNGPWCMTTSICNGQNYAYCSAQVSNQNTIGGNVSGLDANSQVTLQNNGGQNLIIIANGNFVFPNTQVSGSTYKVTVLSQSNVESCEVIDGVGVVNGMMDSILVNCDNPNINPANSCTCKSAWSYAGRNFNGCANPDNDQNGNWCYTNSTCSGNTWSYCSN